MNAAREAPNEVWNVRQVPPPGQAFPNKTNRLWQPLVYTRYERKADGLWVWKVSSVLVNHQYKLPELAERAGKRAAGTIPFNTDVQSFDLSLRLTDVVIDPAMRARIRLGDGWRFLLVLQKKSTSRGTKFLAALCEHNRANKSGVLSSGGSIIGAWGRKDTITLHHRIGRFNKRQCLTLEQFLISYDITSIQANSLPVKPGNHLAPKHYTQR